MAKISKTALAQEGPIFFTPPPTKWEKRLWGGSSKAPAAPDPYATANAQAQANTQAAREQAELNRTNSITPFGTNTWSQGADGRWTQTTSLDPKLQGMLDQLYSGGPPPKLDLSQPQQGIVSSVQSIMAADQGVANNAADIARTRGLATGAGDVLSQLTNQARDKYATALDYSSLGALPEANEGMRQKVEDALYSASASRLDPYWQQQQSDLASSLAAQGITLGGDAYSRATGDFGRSRNDAYLGARNSATTMSTDQMGKLFEMEMARRQQGVGELNYLYNLPMELMGKGQQVYSGLENTLNQDYATNINQRQADQALKSSQISDTLNTFGTLADMRAGEYGSAVDARNNVIAQLQQLAGNSSVAGGAPVNVEAAPIAQSIYNTYQGQLGAANAAQQSRNSLIGTAGTVAGAVAMAF